MFRRVGDISEKLKDPTANSILHLDFNSFSEAEKALFRKVQEIEEEFRKTGNENLLFENADLLLKPSEIIMTRITELYCYVIKTLLACDEKREIVDYFFKLHFYNFEIDLVECLTNVRKNWSDKDREEFLADVKRNDVHPFRIPRGFDECYCKELGASMEAKDSDEKSEQSLKSQ
ncbi:MAG: hypothetical protein ABSF65_10665 [Candidatus Bathyarchaeia archaeon]|jgi:hypothetical protein